MNKKKKNVSQICHDRVYSNNFIYTSSFKISKTEYLRLYPTSSSPRKFYGAAKIHKLPNGGNITELPLRPIVSNIDTASYYLSKYLAQLLSPLRIHR